MSRDEGFRLRPPASQAIGVATLLLLTVLAGCLGAGPADGSGQPGTGRGDKEPLAHGQRFRWNLSGARDEELVLVEIVPSGTGPLEVEVTGEFPVQPPPLSSPMSWATADRPIPCGALWVQGKGKPIFLGPKLYGASTGSSPARLDATSPWPFGETVEFNRRHVVKGVTPNESVPLVFGLDELQQWKSTEASLNVVVEANASLAWRFVDRRAFTCGSRIPVWEQGTHLRTCCVGGPANRRAAVTVARDLAQPMELSSPGLLWAEVGANEEYGLRLAGPNGTVFERMRSNLHQLSGVALRTTCLDSGTWTISVPSLSGTGDVWARFAYAEIPPWMQEMPGEPAGRRMDRSSGSGHAQLISINRC